MSLASRSWLILVTMLWLGCSRAPRGNESALHPIDLAPEWSQVSPTEVGVDAALLDAALQRGSSIDGLTSLILVRHSRLVVELYLDQRGPDSLHSIRSVTKSVISLLIGAALDRGILQSTSQPLSTFFQPPLPAPDGAKGAITIQHLLTMTSGFQWNEGSDVTEYNNWITAPDQISYLFARPLVAVPGTAFNYNSAAVHLLSVILNQASSTGTAPFADEVLFGPLGIHVRDWELDSRGIPNGGAGLYLRPKEMAKVGALILQRGASGMQTVVSADWIGHSTERRLPVGNHLGTLGLLDYGELWWVGRIGQGSVVLAWGYGGQFILIVPNLDLVVVTTAAWQGLGGAAAAQENAIINFLVGDVLPAVKPD